jgi:hypothetical protein
MQHFATAPGQALPTALGGGTVGGQLLTPFEVASLGKAGAAVLCQRVDALGRAAVEVFGKGPSNVLVDLVDEGLIRALAITFGPPSSATGTSEAPSSTAPPNATQIAAVNNAPTTVQTANGSVTNQPGSKPEITQPKSAPAARYVVTRNELVTPANGRSYLVVRVNGPKGNVKIQIAYLGARTVVKKFTRVIPTNKAVKVTHLPKITQAVRSYRVTIAG